MAWEDTALWKEFQISSKERPQEKGLITNAITKFLLNSESAMKEIEGNSSLMFTECHAAGHQIRLCRCFLTMMWSRSTLIRPDREKKTHVQLAPFYDSLISPTKLGLSESS